jgi:hypothetical protein
MLLEDKEGREHEGIQLKNLVYLVLRAYSLGKECIPQRILRLGSREVLEVRSLPLYPSVTANYFARNYVAGLCNSTQFPSDTYLFSSGSSQGYI